jgi:pimeloyl-ACP methyl ester carboxylesterase
MNGSAAFTVTLPDARLEGEARGDNPGFVFLHGLGGSIRTWDRLWAALPAVWPLLRYDLRGYGASQAEVGAPYSHADDLLALLDARGIAQADLCGVSLGGATALNFALNHPQRVRRLVLVSPAMVGWTWSQGWRDIWRSVAKAAKAGDMAEARELWWQHPIFATTRASEAAEDLRASIAAFHGNQWRTDSERPALPDVERLHTLTPPCLLLSGGQDYADFRLIADLLAGAAPQVTRIDFAGAGHMLHMEQPEQVARAIAEFFAASPASNSNGAKL